VGEKQIEKIQKDIEKFKPEKELKLEKLEFKEHKPEGKAEIKEIKEKPEKHEIKDWKEKNELKEHKLEWKESAAKELKFEFEKQLPKEHKPELKEVALEKPPAIEGIVQPPVGDPVESAGLSRDALSQHADALEQAARQLRHFIEQSDRPDLGGGALANEPDAEGGGDQTG